MRENLRVHPQSENGHHNAPTPLSQTSHSRAYTPPTAAVTSTSPPNESLTGEERNGREARGHCCSSRCSIDEPTTIIIINNNKNNNYNNNYKNSTANVNTNVIAVIITK